MATVDNVPTGWVPSDATVDTDLDTRECSGQISLGCELSMVTWTSIEAGISVYVTALTQSLREQGFDPPAWDVAHIASQATDKAQAQLKNPSASGKSSAYVLAVNEANTQMARGLNWDAVTKDVKDYLEYQWRTLQPADIDNIAQEAITETLKKWNPLSETNWSAPGKNFTIAVAKHLANQLVKKNQQPKPQLPPRPPPNPTVDAGALATVIEEWVNQQDQRMGVAFIADRLYNLPKELIALWFGRDRNWWYRKLKEMDKSLGQYLEGNRRRWEI